MNNINITRYKLLDKILGYKLEFSSINETGDAGGFDEFVHTSKHAICDKLAEYLDFNLEYIDLEFEDIDLEEQQQLANSFAFEAFEGSGQVTYKVEPPQEGDTIKVTKEGSREFAKEYLKVCHNIDPKYVEFT